MSKFTKNVVRFWNNYNDRIMLVLFLVQLIAGYNIIQKYFPVGHVLKISFIDNHVPYMPVFALAYLCYTLILFLPFLFVFTNKKQLFAVSTAFFSVATICNICYISFQTMMIRPEIIPSGFFDRLVMFIYSIDKPVNLVPSEHVAFPVLTTLCLCHIKKKSWYILLPITILIILSTLFIKQHYILDVLAGIVVAGIGYLIFKKIMNSK